MTPSEKLLKVAENEQLISDANAELEEALYSKSEGGKSYYDMFWDIYQSNGKRYSYTGAFSGSGWTAETFKPKYDLIVKNSAKNMFANGLANVDVEKHLKDLGISFDTSGVTSIEGFDYFLQYSSPSVMPIIDTRGTTRVRYIFNNCTQLTTVRKLIFKDDGSQTLTSLFTGCSKLVNIVIEGKMGESVSLKDSPLLTKESITSIVNALYEGATGKTLTLNKSAVEAAFTGEEFTALINTKSNWTISLV